MIVLDTHVLVWWTNGDNRLSTEAETEIGRERANENGGLLVSSISAWEIAMLVNAERLTLTMGVDDWLEAAAAIEGLRFVPVDNPVAIESTRLPADFHKDPADRMIVALARHLNAPLVTADAAIQRYEHVRTIW